MIRFSVVAALAALVVVIGCSADPGDDEPESAPAAAGADGAAAGGVDPGDGTAAPGEAGTITLAFGGEVHFEGGVAALLDDPESTLGPLSAQLRRADVAMVNLETALASGGEPASKELEAPGNRFWFRAPPRALDVIARSGVDVVSMANNHGADYGRAGLRESLEVDAKTLVSILGIGRTPEEAYQPFRRAVRGTELAIFAADASPRESNDTTWAIADGTGVGIAAARSPRAPKLAQAVREGAAENDLVVVYLHWGEEGSSCPTPRQRALARTLSEAGADVIVGTHAHVALGAGMLNPQTYVSYGLGDLLWYHGRLPETGVLSLVIGEDGVVTDRWTPARKPLAGGPALPLDGGAAAADIADWRAKTDCTDLTPFTDGARPFTWSVEPIRAGLRQRMIGSSHDPATCPVALDGLRLVRASHYDYDGSVRTGSMIVAADLARETVEIFRDIYDARFPIARMRLVDVYDGNDDRSMAADNSSGYNCRTVAGSSTFSDHAYGRAIDINPVRNPYVTSSGVLPPRGERFVDVDRTPGTRGSNGAAAGVIRRGDPVHEAFVSRGWEWGGDWSQPDYQHFSSP